MSCYDLQQGNTRKDTLIEPPFTIQQRQPHALSKNANIFHKRAWEDYKNKNLQYYFQSIHYPSKQLIQYMKDSLHISIQPTSDYITTEYTAYNQEVTNIILTEKGILIDSIIQIPQR